MSEPICNKEDAGYDDAVAAFSSALKLDISPCGTDYSQEQREKLAFAFEVFSRLSAEGNGYAANFISIYYQVGLPPAHHDPAAFLYWSNRSYESGCIASGNNLYQLYGSPQSKFYNPEKAFEVLCALEEAGMLYVPR